MPRGRALRTLNVNPDTKQKPVAFSAENNITGNKLEKSFKNAQFLKENKLVKQLEQEALVMEQQAASTSKLDPSLDSPKISESDIVKIEEPEECDYFPPSGLLSSSSNMYESSHTTATVKNASNISESLASSSNIVADLHEKLCSSHEQNKKRANTQYSQSSNTNDSLPLLNTIVNETLSVEEDFPLPSTSSAGTCNTGLQTTKSPSAGRKRGKRKCKTTASKQNKKQRKMKEDLALATSIPNILIDNTSSNTPALSDSDSDCEITGYIPSDSQQIVCYGNTTELNVLDQSIFEVDHTYGPPILEQTPQVARFTNRRLGSLINMLSCSLQRNDDEILVIDNAVPESGSEQTDGTNLGRSVTEIGTGSEQTDGTNLRRSVSEIGTVSESSSEHIGGTNLRRSVIEIGPVGESSSEHIGGTNLRNVFETGAVTVARRVIPPVIVVSDDEGEPSVQPALNKQSEPSALELSSKKDATDNGRMWQCPICWEELTTVRGVYSTMCGHVFCNPCITHVLNTTKKCPMCRKSLNKKKVHPLFLDGK